VVGQQLLGVEAALLGEVVVLLRVFLHGRHVAREPLRVVEQVGLDRAQVGRRRGRRRRLLGGVVTTAGGERHRGGDKGEQKGAQRAELLGLG
jgi:hypothetical protein